MRKLTFTAVILCLSIVFVQAQPRQISNAQKKKIQQWNIHKKNNIKRILTAMVGNAKDSFYDGKLVKIENVDTAGKIISTSEYEAYSDSVFSLFKYFDDGYLSEVTKRASANNVLTITYTYDSLGHITRISSYGSERKDYICKYDKAGNLVKKLGYAYYPKFNNKGQKIPNKTDKVLVDEIRYKYDKQNNLISEKVKINGKHIRTTTYKYNKSGLILEELNKYLGNTVRYKYKYDNELKLIEYIRYNIDGSKSYFKIEYEYYNET